jgi:ribosome-binding protein aMBF1 (putative translation factor)
MTIRSIRDLAAAVRGRRKDLGMSQADLARRAGVSRKWIYEFEPELVENAQEQASGGGDPVDLDALLDEHRGQ